MALTMISFSFKNGATPKDAKQVFDCRNLRNPHSVPKLRELDGRDSRVQEYVLNDPKSGGVVFQALQALGRGETVAFGCYGGRHRSVALAEHLAKVLRANGKEVVVEHRALT